MKSWSDVGIDLPSGASGQVYTLCPRCSHTRKKAGARCLSVNVEEGVWHCFHDSCGWSGSLKQGEDKGTRKVYRRPAPQSLGSLPEKAAKYLLGRGITREVWERNQIGYGPVFMPQIDREVTALCFPYLRSGELINRKWRDGQKHFRMETGAERILYKIDDMAETTIIVEGEFDALSCEVAGFQNCVSVPDGAPDVNSKTYASKFSFLEADETRLAKVKAWVLAVDADAPGQRLEEELARRLGAEKCRRVTWPEGIKDANQCLQDLGKGALAQAIEDAKPYPLEGVLGVEDLRADVMRLYTHGLSRGLDTGWPTLDKLYSVKAGEFTVITGYPGSGKSQWADSLMLNMVELHGWVIGICSPESAPLSEYLAGMVEKWSRIPFWQGWNNRLAPDSVEEAMTRLRDHLLFLQDDDKDMTLDWLLDRARQMVFRHGIRGLLIDPWNELEHQRPRELTEGEYIGKALMRIRKFARVNGVHVWIVAHPNKPDQSVRGHLPVPTPYSIAGTAHWRNKADNCLTVYRLLQVDRSVQAERDREFVTDIHVQKVRRKGVGHTGVAHLEFHPDSSTYTDSKPYQASISTEDEGV